MKKNAFGLKSNVSELAPTPPARKELMDARKYLLAVKSDEVISKAIDKALDDEDKDQGMMIKMLMDRMLPLSEFEPKKDGSRTAVTITISGVGDAVIEGKKDDISNVEDV